MTAAAARTRLGALACPAFARLLSGQLVTAIGTQMSNTAAAWVLYRQTHSAAALGLQGLCFSLPIAVLPLLTGVLADRFSRTALVKATLAAEAAQAFALAALASAGTLRPWMLYLAAVADAGRLAVSIPAASALVPNVVPSPVLLSALALSSSTWSSSAMIGPALAGALLAAGPAVVFALNGTCTLVALAAVFSLRPVPVPVPARGTGPARPGGGLAYLREHREVCWLEGVLVVAMTGVLGVETLLPVFAAGLWHAGPGGYGLLRIAPGAGAVLAGAGLSAFPVTGRARILAAAFAGAGLAMGGFAAGPPFAVAFLLLAAGVRMSGRRAGHGRDNGPAGHPRRAARPDQRARLLRAERRGRPGRRRHLEPGRRGRRRPGRRHPGRHHRGRGRAVRGPAGACPPGAGPGWQDGHQYVTRSCWPSGRPSERIGVPHRRQGRPRRP